jgi:hypothetical protein
VTHRPRRDSCASVCRPAACVTAPLPCAYTYSLTVTHTHIRTHTHTHTERERERERERETHSHTHRLTHRTSIHTEQAYTQTYMHMRAQEHILTHTNSPLTITLARIHFRLLLHVCACAQSYRRRWVQLAGQSLMFFKSAEASPPLPPPPHTHTDTHTRTPCLAVAKAPVRDKWAQRCLHRSCYLSFSLSVCGAAAVRLTVLCVRVCT